MIEMSAGTRSFTRHTGGGAAIAVLQGAHLPVATGAGAGLTGRPGAAKSTPMCMNCGNWRAAKGANPVDAGEAATCAPRGVAAYPLLAVGAGRDAVRTAAEELPTRLDFPKTLRSLSRASFAGGGRHRVDIARGHAA